VYRIFSINSIFNVVWYAVVFLALHAAWWWAGAQEDALIIAHAEPLSGWLFSLIHSLPNSKSILQTTGFVLSFIIAVLLNDVIVKNKMIPARNYTTGIFFLLFLSMIPGFSVFSPELIAVFFALKILQKSLIIQKNEKPYSEIFDLGWLSAFAVLFYFPSVWLLAFSLVILIFMRPFSIREWVMVLLGFFGLFFFIFTLYFWFDRVSDFLPHVVNLPHAVPLNYQLSHREIFAGAVFALFLFLSLLAMPRILFSNVIQVRKFFNLLMVMLLLIFLSSFLQANFKFQHFGVFCLPLSVMCSMYFNALKGYFISELLFGMLLLSAVVIHFIK
jgi:hypothetical protein